MRIFILAFACLYGVARAACAAFALEPAQIVFFVDKSERTAFVELVHMSGGPAAVQFSVYERVLDIDGKLVSEGMPKSSDFFVHPSQVILRPNERATVQVQYKGKGRVTADKAYVLVSREVPIEIDDEDGSSVRVNMLTDYYTTLALLTDKPSRLVFVSSKVIGDGKIEVVAENKGAGRVPMDRIYLVVGGKLIKDFTGNGNSIMPGQKRRFTFEYPRAVAARDVQFGR
ncbi:hypothetical protein R80B4_00039 [Fibrobacteres bacterium R8-0-B4]